MSYSKHLTAGFEMSKTIRGIKKCLDSTDVDGLFWKSGSSKKLTRSSLSQNQTTTASRALILMTPITKKT